jgi:hypothetical protein
MPPSIFNFRSLLKENRRVNKIDDYLKKQIQLSTKQATEKDIFLGHAPDDVVHFITIKEIIRSTDVICKKLKEQISEDNLKIIINGNLYDRALLKVLKVTLDLKADYSIIVRDGFKEYKGNLFHSEQVGLLIIKQKK